MFFFRIEKGYNKNSLKKFNGQFINIYTKDNRRLQLTFVDCELNFLKLKNLWSPANENEYIKNAIFKKNNFEKNNKVERDGWNIYKPIVEYTRLNIDFSKNEVLLKIIFYFKEIQI